MERDKRRRCEVKVVGIDLGTSNSGIGYWNGNQVEVIPNGNGESLTPSIISIDEDGTILVGIIAKERLISHPEKTVSVFKRFMGTEKNFVLGPFKFSSVELSALLLKSLKADAERFFSEKCGKAIISVPAYFNNQQRKATLDAAKIAGLEVESLISEPTAAALAYGVHHQKEDSKFAIVDIGGGTFDVSILEMFEGVIQVLAIAGDNFLGGENFTEVILTNFLHIHSLKKEAISATDWKRLYKKSESLKEQLSLSNENEFSIKLNQQTYSYSLSQQQYEKLCGPLFQKLKLPMSRALRDAKLAPKSIDKVILVGGVTKMENIRNYMAKFWGKFPYLSIEPDKAIVIGASIQASLERYDESLSELVLSDVCGFTLGIEVSKIINNRYESGFFSPIIDRNTTIPVSRVETYQTTHSNQKEMRIEIYQGESRLIENNLKIGFLEIKLPSHMSEYQSVDVRFTYDKSGLLEVIVTTEDKKTQKLVIENNSMGSMTESDIQERLKKLNKLKIHPRERSENRLLLARADRIYEESTGVERLLIESQVSKFETVLLSQDDLKIKKAVAVFRKELLQFEEGYNL